MSIFKKKSPHVEDAHPGLTTPANGSRACEVQPDAAPDDNGKHRHDPLEQQLQKAVAAADGQLARRLFGQLADKYSRQLYWQIRRMVNNHDDAADLLQTTFLKAWQGLDQFRGGARLSTWLHKIAINESLTHLEKARREAATGAVPLDDAPAAAVAAVEADSHIDGDDLALRLRKAVAQLPDKQQLVFNMRYYDEMPYEQISEILGTSVGALKASYHIAAKKIEKIITAD